MDMIRLTGLWKTEKKDGSGAYLAGSLSPSSRLLILPNSKKQKEAEPDFIAYLSQPQEKEKKQEKEASSIW